MNKQNSSLIMIIGSVVIGIALLVVFAISVKDQSREDWRLAYASELGLDLTKFTEDLNSSSIKAIVDKDISEGEQRGVNATPTFFVNGDLMQFQSDVKAELTAKINAELKKSKKVTVEEFADFQCPACGDIFPIVQELKTTFKDKKVSWVFKQFPLTSIHPLAMDAAIASEAARAQNKFEEMHNLLFENQDSFTNPKFD